MHTMTLDSLRRVVKDLNSISKSRRHLGEGGGGDGGGGEGGGGDGGGGEGGGGLGGGELGGDAA